jgi:hypothetical protein
MSHIEYQPVLSRIKYTVERYRQFDRSKIRRQMSAVSGRDIEQARPETDTQRLRLTVADLMQICYGIGLYQQIYLQSTGTCRIIRPGRR